MQNVSFKVVVNSDPDQIIYGGGSDLILFKGINPRSNYDILNWVPLPKQFRTSRYSVRLPYPTQSNNKATHFPRLYNYREKIRQVYIAWTTKLSVLFHSINFPSAPSTHVAITAKFIQMLPYCRHFIHLVHYKCRPHHLLNFHSDGSIININLYVVPCLTQSQLRL